MKPYVRILKEPDFVRSTLNEIKEILEWSRDDLEVKFNIIVHNRVAGMPNHRLIRREKRERLKQLCDSLNIKGSDKVFARGGHLLQLLAHSRSPYFRVVEIVGGPSKAKIVSKNQAFELSGRLPGSFESRKR
jgi:hypothetical protein